MYSSMIILLIIVQSAFGQSGSIQGIVIDGNNNPLMFANVILQKNNLVVVEIKTDSLGKYQFSNLEKGIYNLETYKINYSHKRVENIILAETKRVLNIDLPESCYKTVEFTIQYKRPLIDFWNTTQGTIFNADDIPRSPHKN